MPMNWSVTARLFCGSWTAATLSAGRSNPSPSMFTHTMTRDLRSRNDCSALSLIALRHLVIDDHGCKVRCQRVVKFLDLLRPGRSR